MYTSVSKLPGWKTFAESTTPCSPPKPGTTVAKILPSGVFQFPLMKQLSCAFRSCDKLKTLPGETDVRPGTCRCFYQTECRYVQLHMGGEYVLQLWLRRSCERLRCRCVGRSGHSDGKARQRYIPCKFIVIVLLRALCGKRGSMERLRSLS